MDWKSWKPDPGGCMSPLFSECENPIKQLEPSLALLCNRAGVGCLCFVECNQGRDKGSLCGCGRR